MAETVGQHSVAAFTSPVNGTTPIDANTVRGNDNTVRSAYVDHDADPGIHVQSSSLASRPVAGTAGRKWITVSSGRYQLWYDDGARWNEVASDAINVDCLADANLTKGDVVKITGFNNGQNLPTVNKVSASTDTAFGVVENTVTSGNLVQIVNTGLIEDVDTNGYAVGTILYPNTSGGWTTTKPTSGNYQPAGFVLRGNTNNGVLYVEFSAPRIVERSDNTASTIVLRDASGNFSAGTITAGAVTSTGLVTFASLKGTGATTVTNILDEDNMASDSATALATQQSIKAYVDAQVATVDTLAEVLANGNTTGANNIIVTNGQKITTNTIDETTAAAGVTIDSVLLKDDVVNATDIEVDTISANNGTLAVTLGSTGVATIAQQPILSSLTASQAVFTDASKGLVSNAITGTGNVVMSASPTLTGTVTAATINATTLGGTLSTAAQPNVTSLGTLSSLAVTGNLTLGADVVLSRGAADRLDLASGDSLNVVSGTYKIAGTDVLSSNTLGSGVTASSLTSVGTLTSLTVSGTTSLQSQTTMSRQAGAAVNLLFGLRSSVADIATDTAGTIRFLNAAQSSVNMSIADAGDVVIRNNLTVDTNTLYVDAANNRVGVGTASPSTTFHIKGNQELVRLESTSLTGNNYLQWYDSADRKGYFGYAASGNNNLYIMNEESSSSILFGTAAVTNMTLDASGNLGLGVTPSAWGAGSQAMQNGGGAVFQYNNDRIFIGQNNYIDASFADKFIGNGYATRYRQYQGTHAFFVSTASNSSGAGASASFTQAMTLDASGNLGVGTASPGYRLDVSGDIRAVTTGTTRYIIAGSDTQGAVFQQRAQASWGDAFQVYRAGNLKWALQEGSDAFIVNVNSAERARITSGGYLLVGTTSAAADARLVVENTDNTSGDYNYVSRLGANCNDTSSYHLICSTGGADKLYIYGNGTVQNATGTYGTISDERLKQDIVDAGSQWDDLKAVRFRKYRMKTDVEANPDAPYLLGVVAQELEQTSPGLVDEHPDFEEQEVTDEDGNVTTERVQVGTTKSVKSSILLMKAAVALQEAMARIEALEARLEALEA